MDAMVGTGRNLLNLIKKMLLKPNELPTTTYEAKKVVYPLGLKIQKIHACPNGCILYMAMNTRIWMNARYVKQHGIRSGAMILVTSRVNNVLERKSLPRLYGMLL